MSMNVENIYDSVNIRAKHTDGNGNFSENYSTASIETTEIPFGTVYVLGSSNLDFDDVDDEYENFSPALQKNSVHKMGILNGKLDKVLKAWTGRIFQEDAAIAFDSGNNILWRFARKYNDYTGKDFVSLEKYSTVDGIEFIEEVPINTIFNTSTTPQSPRSMLYLLATEYLISDGYELYKLTLSADNNVCTKYQGINSYCAGFASILDETLTVYAFSNETATMKEFDVTDGTFGSDIPLTLDGETINRCYASTSMNNQMFGIFEVNGNSRRLLIIAADGTCSQAGLIENNDITAISPVFTNSSMRLTAYTNESDFTYYGYSLYELALGEETGINIIGDKLYSFAEFSYDDRGGIAFNSNDGCLYHLAYRECESCLGYLDNDDGRREFILEKINPYNLQVTEIDLSGYISQPGEANSIDDGGNDMFDNGNIIRFNGDAIYYTHTTQQNSDTWGENFALMADGQVQNLVISDGGEGSDPSVHGNYFTNMYPGLFVMCAEINDSAIYEFSINGGLGADGGGTQQYDNFFVTVSGNQYTVYWKKIYGANDPSVNHLIMIPSGTIGVTHTIGNSTDSDEDILQNINGVNRIYYLLYAKGSGGQSSLQELEDVATGFLVKADALSNNIESILEEMNENYTDITGLISNRFDFTDYADADWTSGIDSEVSSMTYDEVTNKFYITDSDGQLMSMTPSGYIDFISSDMDVQFSAASGSACIRNKYWTVNEFEEYIYNFSKRTGDILNSGGSKVENSLVMEDGWYNPRFYSMTSYGPYFYAIIEADHDEHPSGFLFIRIDPEIVINEETPFNGFVINTLPNTFEYVKGMAVELHPAEKQLLVASGADEDPNVRASALFMTDPGGELERQVVHVTPNLVYTEHIAQAYYNNAFWRLVFRTDGDRTPRIYFEKVDAYTREVELIHFNEDITPQAMIWNGDSFFVICTEKMFWLNPWLV